MAPQVQPKCFWHLKHMINNWQLKKNGAISSGLVTRRLYFKKMSLNSHFSRPAQSDPYMCSKSNMIFLLLNFRGNICVDELRSCWKWVLMSVTKWTKLVIIVNINPIWCRGLDLVWLRGERGGNEKHLRHHLIGLIKTYAFEECVQIKVYGSLLRRTI